MRSLYGDRPIKECRHDQWNRQFYSTTKGFGFISPSDGGKDAFVHATALEAAGLVAWAARELQPPERPRRQDVCD